jgi:hypothetical protein
VVGYLTLGNLLAALTAFCNRIRASRRASQIAYRLV